MARALRRGEDCPSFPDALVTPIDPNPGQIWKVSFPQTCQAGHEIHGVRRCVVVSANHTHRYNIRLVVLLTESKPADNSSPLAAVLKENTPGLEKDSTAWAFNARNCDLRRFAASSPLGEVSDTDLAAIRLALAEFAGISV